MSKGSKRTRGYGSIGYGRNHSTSFAAGWGKWNPSGPVSWPASAIMWNARRSGAGGPQNDDAARFRPRDRERHRLDGPGDGVRHLHRGDRPLVALGTEVSHRGKAARSIAVRAVAGRPVHEIPSPSGPRVFT